MSSLPDSALLVGLGLIPSLIWLFYYLRKDCHPEPKHLVIRTFLMGIIISPIAILLQLIFVQLGSRFFLGWSQNSATFFIWAAFIEELIKFYAVRLIVLKNPEFDEPIDAMIYMIVAALGFAAMENILVMFRIVPEGTHAALGIWVLRFTGATLLHALSSGFFGYFLAMSWFFQHHRKKLIIMGLITATVFHFTFNIFLSFSDNQLAGLAYSTSLLLVLAFLVSVLFDKIRERHSRSMVNLA